MTAIKLMAMLNRMGVRLVATGNRLQYSPKSAVTTDLEKQLSDHRDTIILMLRPEADIPSIDAKAVWQAAVDQLEGDPDFTFEEIEACRAASVTWETSPVETDSDGWPEDSINPDDLTPCKKCGTLELWQTVADNWRCQKCDSPTKSRQVALKAARLRKSAQNRR